MIFPFDLLRVFAVLWGILITVLWFQLFFFLFSLPLRRRERASFFLDLIDKGIEMGRSPERTIITLSESRDPSVDVRFHLLAAYLETGLRLEEGLRKVPGFLPPTIIAMLKTGEEIGDIKRVLPACHRLIGDGTSKAQGALNYLMLVAFVLTPAIPVPLLLLRIFVLPKWREIFAGLGLSPIPPMTEFVFDHGGTLAVIYTFISIFFYIGVLIYLLGPRLTTWLKEKFSFSFPDRLATWVPWKRRRLQRDFCNMLALLLDSGLPESRAVLEAGRSTANTVFIQKSKHMAARLAEGWKLTNAVQSVDDTGEFRWRLVNAAQGRQGFLSSLTGWLEALEAKAFQQEQTAAQLLTSTLVLLNGLLVGTVVIGLFQALVWLVNEAVLW